VVPLVRASGAGAEARKVMGMAVFSGMLIATIVGVFLVPALFVAVERLTGGKRPAPAPGGAPPEGAHGAAPAPGGGH
jgi:HAE1 family hydrophobic/amphiphilic exporter-1